MCLDMSLDGGVPPPKVQGLMLFILSKPFYLLRCAETRMELYFEVFCPRNGCAALQRLQGVGLVFFARSPDREGGGGK